MRPLRSSADGDALRRCLRDLASLTSLHTQWRNADRRQIAEGLAEVLDRILDPEIVCVRLEHPGRGDVIEVVHPGGAPGVSEQGRALLRAMEPLCGDNLSDPAVLSLPLESVGGSMEAAVIPIGYGCEFGIAGVASGRPGFPSEEDRLLLSVAANQAASVLQHQAVGESQSLLAAIVESSQDAIISKTLEGIITSWNAGAEALFGYTADEAIGRPITLIIPPGRQHEEQMILERLRRGERIEHYQTIRQHKRGSLIDISLVISPVRDSTGRIIGASKVARDITSAKKAEEALKEADRRKDEFLAMLAHELRNPLAPIRNAIEILHAQGPEERELEWARSMIERQVHQMSRLVDDLLDVSRITRGKIALRKERVDLAAVVASAVEACRPLIDERGHRLTVAMPAEPIALEADPARISQVLLNLLNNAAKYTDPGGQIWLTAEREQEGVAIRVRDNGIGIDPALLPRVFDLFTQAEHSPERTQGGLGIGLTLVQRLVEMHGGMVTAHSEGPGKGTELVVHMPLARGDGSRTPEAADERQGAVRLSPSSILVVDDNRDAAESLAFLLQIWGHEVHVAYDGQQALEAAAAFCPDVVFLDLGMPKMSGYEVARLIREARRDRVVLIALTGWGQEEDRRRSSEAGFDLHLIKPVDLEALQTALAAATRQRCC